jgi:hypothetical protein
MKTPPCDDVLFLKEKMVASKLGGAALKLT